MADWCASTASTRILYLWKEAVLRKTPHFKSIDCNTEAIRRSSWPICYCMEKSEPDTNTPNYCNPAAHACQGLIMFHNNNVRHAFMQVYTTKKTMGPR